ncbi:hypothetical protein EVG20_g8390 [Dentipellis fragilis]|uniref:CFEM domain-containing protein n=1 Tax=Dentipellis fragilis TaxID=205917 RepID=A0A4Y9Y6K8_9AGAM|nr:hypothetical protein EVG20_g8390 [Dentipellis fragilis]
MRFTFAIFAAAVASTASASNILARQAGYPNCAVPCLTSADFGSCSQTDLKCLCTSANFITSVTQCIESSCQGSDLTNAEAAAQSECAAIGVSLTSSIPGPTSSAPSSSAPSSTAPSSGSPSSSAPAGTSPSPSSGSGAASGALMNGPNALAAAAALGLAVLAL